jgi:GNAT superfamily N-acetyltransferase
MIFETEGFYIDLVENADINDVVEVYNSNRKFLQNHIGTDQVAKEWILDEIESMRKVDFYSCKIVEKNSGKLIGIIDFKIGEETYLSILMLHKDYKKKGLGSLVYKGLEKYAKSEESNRMRIDVVIGYDDAVLDFWTRNGFVKFKNIELNWTGKILPAVIMKKNL